jgi:hypothetical protein
MHIYGMEHVYITSKLSNSDPHTATAIHHLHRTHYTTYRNKIHTVSTTNQMFAHKKHSKLQFLTIFNGGKQWQTTPKNLPRIQRTRATQVA